MAINQFSQPHKFPGYTDPFSLTVFANVLDKKEAAFESGARAVQQDLDALHANLKVTRNIDQKYINDKLNDLTSQINSIGDQDWGDLAVQNQIRGLSKDITQDQTIINAVYSTRAIQGKLDEIKQIKEKHPEMYSSDNEADALKSVNDYLNNPSVGAKFQDTTPFSPYYDYGKEKNDLVDQFYKMPSGFTQDINDGAGHITTIKYTGKSPEMLRQYLKANLSDKARNQLAIEGRVRTDHVDPETFYNEVYVPSRGPGFLDNQDKINKLEQKKAKATDSNEIADLNNQIAQLEKKNEDIQNSLLTDRDKVLANKREIGGQINIERYIDNIAASVAIPPIESISSKEDKAYFDQLNAATDSARVAAYRARSNSSSSKSKGTSEEVAPGVYADGRVPATHQVIDTKDQDVKTTFEDFQNQKQSLWQNTVDAFTPLFAKYMSTQSAQKGVSMADALGNYDKYKQEFANYVKANIDKWKKNHNDKTIPEEYRKVIEANVRSTDLYLDMESKAQNEIDGIAEQAQQQGVQPIKVNGVTISLRDMAEKALTGKNDNIDFNAYEEDPAHLGYQYAVPGQFSAPGVAPISVNEKRLSAELRDRMKIIQPSVNEALNEFSHSFTKDNATWSISKDDKNPANKDTFNYYTNLIANYASQGSQVINTEGKRVKNPPIDPTQINWFRVNDATGMVTFSIPVKVKTEDGVTQTIPQNLTMQIPDVMKNFSEENYYLKRLTFRDGNVPMVSEGQKPIAYTLTTNGTPESGYTLDETGQSALYYPLINGAVPKNFPAQARPEDVVALMNNQVAISQRDKIQQVLDENKRLYDAQNGTGAWEKLPYTMRKEVAKQIIEEERDNLKESDSFTLSDDSTDEFEY